MSELGNSRFSDANALPWVESTGNEEQLKALESTALLPEPNQNDPPAQQRLEKWSTGQEGSIVAVITLDSPEARKLSRKLESAGLTVLKINASDSLKKFTEKFDNLNKKSISELHVVDDTISRVQVH